MKHPLTFFLDPSANTLDVRKPETFASTDHHDEDDAWKGRRVRKSVNYKEPSLTKYASPIGTFHRADQRAQENAKTGRSIPGRDFESSFCQAIIRPRQSCAVRMAHNPHNQRRVNAI